MKLLALDLSTNVGWAVMVRGSPPVLGTLVLKGNMVQRMGQYLLWLDRMHDDHKFDALVWERPLLMRTDTVDKLEILYGLVGITAGVASMYDLRHREVTVQEAKMTLTGKANATKEEMLKAAMIDLKWRCVTHHEADAGAVGIFAMNVLNPKEKAR